MTDKPRKWKVEVRSIFHSDAETEEAAALAALKNLDLISAEEANQPIRLFVKGAEYRGYISQAKLGSLVEGYHVEKVKHAAQENRVGKVEDGQQK